MAEADQASIATVVITITINIAQVEASRRTLGIVVMVTEVVTVVES
jgi:hypothetical protein